MVNFDADTQRTVDADPDELVHTSGFTEYIVQL